MPFFVRSVPFFCGRNALFRTEELRRVTAPFLIVTNYLTKSMEPRKLSRINDSSIGYNFQAAFSSSSFRQRILTPENRRKKVQTASIREHVSWTRLDCPFKNAENWLFSAAHYAFTEVPGRNDIS